MKSKPFLAVIWVLAAMLLSACGGSSSNIPPPPPSPPPGGGTDPSGGTGGNLSIGGTVSGLTGAGLVLQNNGGDNLSLSADGGFTFAAQLADNSAYSVTVSAQPAGQTCTVANGSGTLAGANVSNVAVTCVASPTSGMPATPMLALSYGIKQLKFTWDAVSDATHYQLLENPDGVSGYTQVGSDLTATAYDHDIALHRSVNARYLLKACNNAGCTNSSEVSMSTGLTAAIGYIKASNTGADNIFGTSVALSGDGTTLAVGAGGEASNATGIGGNQSDNSALNAGAVYVYTRSSGAWVLQAYVKASNTEANDYFGTSVALSDDGNTLAVGAPGEASNATTVDGDSGNNSAANAGAVYVYTRSGDTWTPPTYVKASNTGENDEFGFALALSGDGNTLAVGAGGEAGNATGIGGDQDDNSALDAGAVYVYIRSRAGWMQQAYVKASNTQENDRFGGTALALSDDGNTLAVGVYEEASNSTGINRDQSNDSAEEAGAVYVYTRSADTWTQEAYVKASNTEAQDYFGTSLALSGDGNTLAVGADGEDSNATGIGGEQNNNSVLDPGAVYVYTRSAGVWTQQAYVKAGNTGAEDYFGWSVALSDDGNTLAVGARFEDSNATGIGGNQGDDSAFNAGAIYVYTRSADTWTSHAYIKAPNPEAEDFFGTSVALSGDGNTLAVGATSEDSNATGVGGNQNDNSLSGTGAVYLY